MSAANTDLAWDYVVLILIEVTILSLMAASALKTCTPIDTISPSPPLALTLRFLRPKEGESLS